MGISLHRLAVESFAPMLDSLSGVLAKGAAHAKGEEAGLIEARLAPDMYTLAQQVQLACYHARDAVALLSGRAPPAIETAETGFAGLMAQIARTVEAIRAVPEAEFAGAEARDCSKRTPNGLLIEMDGARLLTVWALPQFYFHVVTAYDILRHRGVAIGKQDYLRHAGRFIRARQS